MPNGLFKEDVFLDRYVNLILKFNVLNSTDSSFV